MTYRRQEFKHVLLNLTYLALIAFVAWGASARVLQRAYWARWLLDAESEPPVNKGMPTFVSSRQQRRDAASNS